MNSTTTKKYTPTTTARPTWREREATKERQQREAVARAADDAQRKKIAKTEENFPTMMKPVDRVTIRPPGKFAELAAKMQAAKEIERELENYRKAKSDRERSVIRDTVIFLRNRRTRDDDYYESEEEALERENMSYEEDEVEEETPDEKFPPHGKRGTYTAPDIEGWRTVVRRTRRQPQELTEAQLVQKYRDEFFGGDAEDEADHNGDLMDRNQRREFY
jgi:hypothetical protein